MEKKPQGQLAARKELHEASRWLHRNYGNDLAAFFRDAFHHERTGEIRALDPNEIKEEVKKVRVAGGGG